MDLRAPALAPAADAATWQALADEAAFTGLFTRAAGGGQRYAQLEALVLSPREHAQLTEASAALSQILSRVTEWVQLSPPLLTVLDIPAPLVDWVRLAPGSGPFSLLARFDWLQDQGGRWWCVECNADTPGGLPEATVWQALCHPLHPGTQNPNRSLIDRLGAALRAALPGTPGFVTAPGQVEDWENLLVAARAFSAPGRICVNGGLPQVADGTVLVDQIPVESLYKFYPGDWLVHHPHLLPPLTAGLPCVNPGRALIAQSKAMFALLYHLAETGQFLTPTERDWVRTCIPHTSLEPLAGPWVAKPYWQREGGGIFAGAGPASALGTHIYQERIVAAATPCPVYSLTGVPTAVTTPVLGVYVVADQPAGYLGRIGGAITDGSAHALPVYVADAAREGGVA